MLTKQKTGMTRKFKYAVVALALLAVLVFSFASCDEATPTGVEYVAGTAAKVEYEPGDVFECTGAKIRVTYDSGVAEMVDVTPEMVGNAPLTLSTESVSVTYSENGATLITHIPVTVKDPNAKLKSDAIAALNANAKVVANSVDTGVGLILTDYVAQIKLAENKKEIQALTAAFEADITKYLADKAEIVDAFEADALVAKIGELLAQYRSDINTAKTNAIANVKAASTIEEAEGYLAAFEVAVDNKLAEQKYYENNGNGAFDPNGSGQIFDKIALLEQLDAYELEIEKFEDIVIEANLANKAESLEYYAGVRSEISRLRKYITLAIDLSTIDLESDIGADLITEVDNAVTYILSFDSITICPLAYVNGVLATTSDTQTFLDTVENKFVEARKIFGDLGVEKLKAEYGQDATAKEDYATELDYYSDNFINDLIATIQNRYDELNAIRENAVAAVPATEYAPYAPDVTGIINLIDYAAGLDSTGVEGDAQDMAIRAAWDAVKAWAAANAVFTTDDTDGSKTPTITYNKEFGAVIYTATGFDADAQKWTTIDDTWDAYAVDLDYVETYYIPNIEDLITASQARYAAQAQLAIMNTKLDLDNLFYSLDADVDSEEEIKDARKRYDAFNTAYASVYNTYFIVDGKDVYKDRLVAAEEKYADLVAKADAAVAAINVYYDLINGDVANIVVSHYVENVGALWNAYDKYLTFAEANAAVANADKAAYTDVITNEAFLLACMEQYATKVAYMDTKDVESAKTITDAWKLRDDAAKVATEPVDPNFRTALEIYVADMINYIQNNYSYTALPTLNVDGVDVDADNAKFFYNQILAENEAEVTEAAASVAEVIANSVFSGADADGNAFGLYNPFRTNSMGGI